MRSWLLLALLASCTDSPDVLKARQIPAELAADVTAIAEANNAFACDAYAQLRTQPGNQFFSPFSVSTALAMVDAGAAGDTDAQLRAALHFTLPADQQNAAYGALLDSLDRGIGYGAYSLATANRLFGQTGYMFLPSFVDVTRDHYGAELETVDFADPTTAAATINDWVSDQTEGTIPELFQPEHFDSMTRIALANAIYFKGRWEIDFDPARPRTFQRADGTTVTVPIMSGGPSAAVANIAGADGTPLGTLGVVPFRGKDLSFMVLLPTAYDGLPSLEAELTGESLARWIAASRIPGWELSMPKFQIESDIDLVPALKMLGIHDAYDPLLADFSAMTGDPGLHLQETIHKAWISVDEQGAEAAAATGVTGGVVSLPPQFEVDHPFVFLIYDEVTHTVLFMGRVVEP